MNDPDNKSSALVLAVTRSLDRVSSIARNVFPYLLLLMFGLFMLGYFLFPDYSVHYRFFKKGVFVLGVFAIAGGFREARHHPVFKAILVYLCYLLLSGLWSEPMDWARYGQKWALAIFVVVFILINVYLVKWNRDLYERVLQTCVLIAVAAALANILTFYSNHQFPIDRLQGVGSLTNINEFANIYGVFALLAMMFAQRYRVNELKRWVLFFAVGVFLTFAWFGQSRTAFVSMVAALLALVFLNTGKRWLYVFAVLGVVGILAAVYPELVKLAIDRGEGLRPQIWRDAWEGINTAFLFGNGLVAASSVTLDGVEITTVHNAYLQVFWQAGVIGLVVFMYLLAISLQGAWRWGQETQEFAIFCMFLFAMAVMMTGVDTLINRPRDQWMLFWFPVAMLIAYQSTASPLTLQKQRKS